MENPHSTKLTYEDYCLLPDDGKRHEVIDGEHFMTPAPKSTHQQVSMNLTVSLGIFLRQHRLGQIFAAPYDVVPSDVDVVQPDLVFVSTAKSSMITEANIQGIPDFVIEILSEGTRKTVESIKRKLYERFGVSEYWIVDAELEIVKVYRLLGHRYQRMAELTREANYILTPPLLPGLQLALAELFA